MKRKIIEQALKRGFDLAGIVTRDQIESKGLPEAVKHYEEWLGHGYGASMDFLRRHLPQKRNPDLLLKEWRSVLCVGLEYGASRDPIPKSNHALISNYAAGADYHNDIMRRLSALSLELQKQDIRGFAFVDAQPVMERFWAAAAGLGWIGKNSFLINKQRGSYLFLGGLFLAVELEQDKRQPSLCGDCRRCIDACPTHAITGKGIDSNRCIAFHTIENRGGIPADIMKQMDRWIAGCDICQDVCPWNKKREMPWHSEQTNPALNASLRELCLWSAADFKMKLKNVAMVRQKYSGFTRNLIIAVTNSTLPTTEKRSLLNDIQRHFDHWPPATNERTVLERTWAWAHTQIETLETAR